MNSQPRFILLDADGYEVDTFYRRAVALATVDHLVQKAKHLGTTIDLTLVDQVYDEVILDTKSLFPRTY